jgi:hypothetical protein
MPFIEVPPLRVLTKPKPPFNAPVGAAEPGNGLLNVGAEELLVLKIPAMDGVG